MPITVDVAGTVSDSDTMATLNPVLAYSVFATGTDQQVGHGTATIASDGRYSFDVRLKGRGIGRHGSSTGFTIGVMASDSAGNAGSDSARNGYVGGQTITLAGTAGRREVALG